MQRAATRRLGRVVDAIAVSAESEVSAGPALNTSSHPANQRFALGRARKLRVLTEEQLSLFWENGVRAAGPAALPCPSLSAPLLRAERDPGGALELTGCLRVCQFLVVEDLLGEAEVAALAERTDAIARGETGNPTEVLQIEPSVDGAELSPEERVLAVRKLFNLCDTDEPMFQHASNPKIVDVIADLLGADDIKVYGDQLCAPARPPLARFSPRTLAATWPPCLLTTMPVPDAVMKNPSVGSSIPWHQDSTSWMNIYPRDLVSAWTAIDQATTENGCLHFIPGSHRWGLIGPTRGGEGTEHPMSEDFMSDTERWPSVPVPLRPGSVSFHHSMTMHKSGANTSGLRRRGYAIHYMRASSVPDGEITQGAKGSMAQNYRSVRGRSFEGRV
jgi:hypothetical protein